MEAQGIACRQHMSQASDKLCQTKPEPVKRPVGDLVAGGQRSVLCEFGLDQSPDNQFT